jgi:acetyl esterase/lipase
MRLLGRKAIVGCPELGALGERAQATASDGTLAALVCLRGPTRTRKSRDSVRDHRPQRVAAVDARRSLRVGLDADTIGFFDAERVPDLARWSDRVVGPLHPSDLRGVPVTVVATAEHDPLSDEAAAYATWLRRAGPDPQLPGARPDVVRGRPPTALPTTGSLFRALRRLRCPVWLGLGSIDELSRIRADDRVR